jgi:hypothetical protein
MTAPELRSEKQWAVIDRPYKIKTNLVYLFQLRFRKPGVAQ